MIKFTPTELGMITGLDFSKTEGLQGKDIESITPEQAQGALEDLRNRYPSPTAAQTTTINSITSKLASVVNAEHTPILRDMLPVPRRLPFPVPPRPGVPLKPISGPFHPLPKPVQPKPYNPPIPTPKPTGPIVSPPHPSPGPKPYGPTNPKLVPTGPWHSNPVTSK